MISQLQRYVFGYGLILLAIVAAISIGKKLQINNIIDWIFQSFFIYIIFYG